MCLLRVVKHACFLRQTLSGYNKAGHTVRYTGAGCKKSDAHNDFWDSKRVAYYGHLDGNTEETGCVWVCVRKCVYLLGCTGLFPTIQTMR